MHLWCRMGPFKRQFKDPQVAPTPQLGNRWFPGDDGRLLLLLLKPLKASASTGSLPGVDLLL